MEYVYAALLLHKLGKAIDVESINKIMHSVSATVDESKVKSLVASLKNIDIEKELENAIVASAMPVSAGKSEAHSEEAPKEEKKSEEASAAGLSALFG
ncbi:MAG: 50S ribosomal protein L12 [Nanoarchaeota archaeon]